jgi:hypothetical protein
MESAFSTLEWEVFRSLAGRISFSGYLEEGKKTPCGQLNARESNDVRLLARCEIDPMSAHFIRTTKQYYEVEPTDRTGLSFEKIAGDYGAARSCLLRGAHAMERRCKRD